MANHVRYCPDHALLVPLDVAEQLQRERSAPALLIESGEPVPLESADALRQLAFKPEVADQWPAPSSDGEQASQAATRMKVYCLSELEKMCEKFSVSCSDSDRRERLRLMCLELIDRGEYRKLRPVAPAWRSELDALESLFPHFVQVIDYLRVCFALAEANGTACRPDPILLAGGPGVGKSFFAQSLAEMLGAGFEVMRMENAQSSAALAGSAEFWSNTQPGKVFESLLLGEHANPTFYLDEVDKVNPNMTYDPLSPLYSLLQPETARVFADASYPNLKIDASWITWIMTCNDPTRVPVPLLSRMVRFDIAPATDGQARVIAGKIVKTLIAELSPASTGIVFQDGAIEQLSRLSPRQMRQTARIAIGRCVFEHRCFVGPADIVLTGPTEDRRMGFM